MFGRIGSMIDGHMAVGVSWRGWPDDPLLQGGDRASPSQAGARTRDEGLASGRCRVGLHEASARAPGYAEHCFRPCVAAEGEEVSLSDADAYMTGSWAATRGRWRCPSPISPDSRST